MNDEDQKELARRRAYDEWVDHFERFLRENGAPENHSRVLTRHWIWWGSVIAKSHRVLTVAVVIGAVTSLIALAATLTVRDMLPWSR